MSDFMENQVYNAAMDGDIAIFSNPLYKTEHFLKKTYQNNNILHVAAKNEQTHFIKAVLDHLPKPTCESLICDLNSQGNTPIHIAAEVGSEAIVVQLCELYLDSEDGHMLPWRVSNLEGNTPAHVALLYGYVKVAGYLVEKDGYLATLVNHSKETLLHLAIRYHVHGNYESEITITQGQSSNEKLFTPREDLQPILELLLKTESSVACWVDVDGSTPLHRATSLEPSHRLPVIRTILNSCPQAAEVHDEHSDQSVLHLLMTNCPVPGYGEGVELLRMKELYAIRNCKNHQGDTPLHLAARNNDTNMVRALLRSSPNLNIKNKNGISAGSLVQQLCFAPLKHQMGNTGALVERRELTEEECTAAKEGNFRILNEKLESEGILFLVSRTAMGGNILHIMMSSEGRLNGEGLIRAAEKFIGKAVRKSPSLITQKDFNGDTPVHILASHIGWPLELLKVFNTLFMMAIEEAGDNVARGMLNCSPWRQRNVKGDTPLHAAARAGNDDAVLRIISYDEEVAGYVNNRNETPLHLRCYNKVIPRNYEIETITREVITSLTKGYGNQPYMQDVDGRTFWHMFVYRPADKKSSFFADYIFKSLDLDYRTKGLLQIKDNDGNTPLHMAIVNRHFGFAKFYLSNVYIDLGLTFMDPIQVILEAKNNDGISCYDLIGADEHLPREFEKFLWKKGKFYGHRSLYGVPTTKINNYANTVGVIAALLTTITFTAGFTVPGGLDSSNGTPLLLRSAAFKVFMVSDVVAICLSVMVLFCLLWIMTTGHKRESIVLLDLSLFLLEGSFYATVMTFMTGLYVTTIHIVPGIAIFTCAICSLLILIMHKSFVLVTVAPFCGFWIILFLALKEFATDKLSALWSPLMIYTREILEWLKLRLEARFGDYEPRVRVSR